jgi:hypothetical protein
MCPQSRSQQRPLDCSCIELLLDTESACHSIILVAIPGLMRPETEANHLFPSAVKIKNGEAILRPPTGFNSLIIN